MTQGDEEHPTSRIRSKSGVVDSRAEVEVRRGEHVHATDDHIGKSKGSSSTLKTTP
jgi:hypothetical protein